MSHMRYLRITLVSTPGLPKPKPFFLSVTSDNEKFVQGVEVGLDGDEIEKNVGGKRVHVTRHIIDKTCIAKAEPYVMSNKYAMLEKA